MQKTEASDEFPALFATNAANEFRIHTTTNKIKEPIKPRDKRAISLEKFLAKKVSYLSKYTDLLIELADSYKIDYKLPVAIAGIESSYCNANAFAYNCWGFGDYAWPTEEAGIRGYYQIMNKLYFSKDRRTISQIAEIYNPNPSTYIAKYNSFYAQIP